MEFPESETQNPNFGYPNTSLAQTPKCTRGCQRTSEDARGRQRTSEDAKERQRTPEDAKNEALSKGKKAKLKTKLDYEKKQRLLSLVRVLKKFQQSGSQNPQLNEKIKMLEDQLKRQETAAATANTATSTVIPEGPGKSPGEKI